MDLSDCAKDLFVVAIGPCSPMGRAADRSRVLLRGGSPPSFRPHARSDHGRRSELASRSSAAEINRVFGDGHAAAHPELAIAVVNAASSDWAASRLAVAIERVAEGAAGRKGGSAAGPGIVHTG
jgi:hypothetical protein